MAFPPVNPKRKRTEVEQETPGTPFQPPLRAVDENNNPLRNAQERAREQGIIPFAYHDVNPSDEFGFIVQSAKLAREKATQRIEKAESDLKVETTARLEALSRLEDEKRARSNLQRELDEERERRKEVEEFNKTLTEENTLHIDENFKLAEKLELFRQEHGRIVSSYESKFIETQQALGNLVQDVTELKSEKEKLKEERNALQQRVAELTETAAQEKLVLSQELQSLRDSQKSLQAQLDEAHTTLLREQARIALLTQELEHQTILTNQLNEEKRELENELLEAQHRLPPVIDQPIAPAPEPIENFNNDYAPAFQDGDDEDAVANNNPAPPADVVPAANAPTICLWSQKFGARSNKTCAGAFTDHYHRSFGDFTLCLRHTCTKQEAGCRLMTRFPQGTTCTACCRSDEAKARIKARDIARHRGVEDEEDD